MIKIAFYGGIIAILLLSHYKMLLIGKDIQAGIEAQARQDLIETQKEKVKIVYREKVKIEVKYRDRVKTIYQIKDDTGCLDIKLGTLGVLSSSSSD